MGYGWLLWLGCAGEGKESIRGGESVDSAPTGDPALIELGDEVVCAAPVEGFDRLREATAEVGLLRDSASLDPRFSMLTSGDLDGDGDVDLLLSSTVGAPALFENEGGRFVQRAGPPGYTLAATQVLADLSGDGLPELITARPGAIAAHDNLGGLQFSAERLLWSSGLPYSLPGALALGDVDGDGDLDLHQSGLIWADDACDLDPSCPEYAPSSGGPHLIFEGEGGAFSLRDTIYPGDADCYSVVATFTDRDGDGDADLLLPQDLGASVPGEPPPMAFYRNDRAGAGWPGWTDVAEEVYAAISLSGMGVATLDLNEDGAFDYCVTDTGPIHCLMSDGAGGYVDAGLAMGLMPEDLDGESRAWSAWTVEAVDLDNDGLIDMAATGGRPPGEVQSVRPYADALFRGVAPDVFEDWSAETGFNSEEDHFGMVAADFSGDGFLDLVVSSEFGGLTYWDNPCGAGAWVVIDPVGTGENAEAVGARIDVEAGGRAYSGEIQTQRARGQGPPVFHVGLGGAERIEVLRVTWPGGEAVEYRDLPVRRRITVYQER